MENWCYNIRCCVCLNFRAQIHSCVNGHTTCTQCFNSVQRCPMCRCAKTKMFPNRLFEDILVNTGLPCVHLSCGRIFNSQNIHNFGDHSVTCRFRPLQCFLCKDSVPLCQYTNHLKKHTNDYVDISIDNIENDELGTMLHTWFDNTSTDVFVVNLISSYHQDTSLVMKKTKNVLSCQVYQPNVNVGVVLEYQAEGYMKWKAGKVDTSCVFTAELPSKVSHLFLEIDNVSFSST